MALSSASALVLPALIAGALGCSRQDGSRPAATPATTGASGPATVASSPSSHIAAPGASAAASSAAGETLSLLARQRLHAAARACDEGRYDNATTLLDQLGDGGGLGARLLKARLALAAGDNIACLRELEAARAGAPADVRVAATAAEVYCALGRLPAAEDEIKRGLELDAESPELLRARAALMLSRPGRATEGLALLERALQRDPELEYAHNLLRQALVLAGRAKLQSQDPGAALELAERALAAEPGDAPARELKAEALAALNLYEEAIACYEQLAPDGRDSTATLALLHQRAATQCLLKKERAKAIEHYLRARALGARDAELGYGGEMLFEEAAEEVKAGVADFKNEDLASAAARFCRALALDPGSIEARNHLAVVQFKQGDWAAAAQGWAAVLEQAAREHIELPEPVHLNLARAYLKSGRDVEARALLEAYLRAHGQGEWAPQTRGLLDQVPASKLPAPKALEEQASKG